MREAKRSPARAGAAASGQGRIAAMMLGYSLLLALGLTLSAPWWLTRMLTTDRYREGLGQRLGRVPAALRAAARGKRVVWLHAVSVGEVLAATRLVADLELALGDDFRIVVSTTTRTGQALAQQRCGAQRVFYYPLDFAFAVRSHLDALRPEALVLMESELWPRMLTECNRRHIPVAVANARVSDRSFARAQRFRSIWSRLLAKVALFLAQSEEDARRLVTLGASQPGVHVSGNLKYDVRASKQSRVADLIHEAAAGRPIIVAGSTVDQPTDFREESAVIRAWEGSARSEQKALLVLAPRHPERFGLIEGVVCGFSYSRASDWNGQPGERRLRPVEARANNDLKTGKIDVVLLDTIGDLASVYAIADVAFVGGSLVPRGGHNPLEPAQFGVPVIMGPSFENFRDIVAKMQAADGIRIVRSTQALSDMLFHLLANPDEARRIGERGRSVFDAETGATARTVAAIRVLLDGAAR